MGQDDFTLRDWLRTGDRSPAWLAEQLDVSVSTVYDWMNHRRSPELRSALMIEHLSDGVITPRKLVPPEWVAANLS